MNGFENLLALAKIKKNSTMKNISLLFIYSDFKIRSS